MAETACETPRRAGFPLARESVTAAPDAATPALRPDASRGLASFLVTGAMFVATQALLLIGSWIAARTAHVGIFVGLGLANAALWAIAIALVWRIHARGRDSEIRMLLTEKRFRDYAEVASDWFWEMNAELRFAFFSKRFAEVTGVAGSELLGKTRLEVGRGGASDEEWQQHLADLAAHREFRNYRYTYARPDGGTQVWSISGKPIFDAAGRFCGYRGTGTDVTVEVRALNELQQAKDQAESASGAKSAFLAGISHELRTPLNAILGFSEIIRDQIFGPVGNAHYVDYAHDIYGAGQHLLLLINDLLDLAKIEAGKAEVEEEDVDMAAVAEWAVKLTRARMRKQGLACHLDCGCDTPHVRADERRMRQVLVNLLSNAIKFTPTGGSVRIRLRADERQGLALSVRDTGIGMAKADIPKALSPFGQLDSGGNRRFAGTGLGLSLAKSIAELHQGRLSIDSDPGTGTTVTVVLPPERLIAARSASRERYATRR